MSDYLVVGSGPAGVACAHALLQAGASVHMVDAGITLSPERHALVEPLASRPPEEWDPEDVAVHQAWMQPDARGVPLKLVYGSDFPYRSAGERLGLRTIGSGLLPSFARGGLSNVWGAAMMPYLPEDVDTWPIERSALSPHYEAVLRLTGLSAEADGLLEHFPLYTDSATTLDLSEQSRRLLGTMEAHRDGLREGGIVFGRSRLAVRGNGTGEPDGCVYCGMCLHGCPYGMIYNATWTLTHLERHPRFSYEPGVIVESVRERPDGVTISGRQLRSGDPVAREADRVFVAAGPIPTTSILMRSMGMYDEPIDLLDSQYFFVPMLTRRVPGATEERAVALSQLFVELLDPNGRERSAHIQLYSNSDLISVMVESAFGWFRRPLRGGIRALLERLVVAQGFLHSDHSSRIRLRLQPEAGDGRETLEVRGVVNPEGARMVRAVVKRLSRHARDLGARPLKPLVKIAAPGQGFHAGGSFPMSSAPGRTTSDTLGRPTGWIRTHAVDATVLPNIPATTITLSVMANAHRIGESAARLDNPA